MPELRFPEFRDAGEWERIELGCIGKVSMCKRILKDETRPDGDVPFYKIGTFGKQADAYIDRETYENYKSKYSYPKKGDILISASGTIGRLVVFDGAEAYFQDSNIVWIDNNQDLVKNEFLFYCYGCIKWVTDDNTIARLYNDNLRHMNMLITSISEQQKIADCLSSIDNLITAHTQKHNALKAHKKSLMQQLFPAEGETLPKLRFPEFRGEWNDELLEKLYDFKVTNSYSRDKLNYEKGTVKNIHYGDIHTKFSTLFDIKKETVPFINSSESLEKIRPECFCMEGDLIFADASEDMDDVGKSIEIINLNNEKLLSGLHTILARQKDEKLLIGFSGHLFKSNRIRVQIKKEAQGAKILGLSLGRMLNVKVSYPADKKEQQKIADCLSVIDELITVQSEKIESLKIYKKGLMQKLFPSTDEMNG